MSTVKSLATGQTRFVVRSVKNTRLLKFVAHVACIRCGSPIVVEYGVPYAVFTIGCELVGISCEKCLNKPSREHLAERRRRAGVDDEVTA